MRVLAVSLVLLVVLDVLLLLALFVFGGSAGDSNGLLLFGGTQVAVALTQAVCTLWVVAWLSRALYRSLLKLVPEHGALLIGTLVACLVWRDASWSIFIKTPGTVITSLQVSLRADSAEVPSRLPVAEAARTDSAAVASAANGVDAARFLVADVLYWSTRQLAIVGEYVRELPAWSVASFILTMLAVGHLAGRSGDAQSPTRLLVWWGSLSSGRRHSLGNGLVVVAGAYFGIAAIIAIPRMAVESSDSVLTKPEEFRSRLRSVVVVPRADSVPIATTPALLVQAEEVKKRIGTARAMLQGPAATSTNGERVRRETGWAAQAIDDAMRGHAEIVRSYEMIRAQHLTSIEAARDAAIEDYQTLHGIGGLADELVERGAALTRHVRSRAANATADIARMRSSVIDGEEALRSWLPAVGIAYAEDSARMEDTSFATTSVPSSLSIAMSREPRPQYRYSDYGPDFWVPSGPRPGAGLGVFGVISSWLLSTRSLAIVQLVGMLGFGMLGAVLATIRAKPASTTQHEASGAPAALLSAFSATMVVFLAVNGGLAVVVDGDAQPNSYVLLLTCFVAAVYSQSVWDWAKRWLDERLGNGEERKPSPAGATPGAASTPEAESQEGAQR